MSPEVDDNEVLASRGRVRQIFRFLKDFNALKNPLIRQLSEEAWVLKLTDLPQHPGLWFRGRDAAQGDERSNDKNLLLSIRRPTLEPPPAIEDVLLGWVQGPFNDPLVEKISNLPRRELTNAGGEAVVEEFDSSPKRVEAFDLWSRKWRIWAAEQGPARQTLELFNRLYELRGRIEREGESVQLLAGQGMLVWARAEGDVRHPIVTQRLELTFLADDAEFQVRETEQPPELLRSFLIPDQPGAAKTIQQVEEDLVKQDVDLTSDQEVEGLLRRLVLSLHSGGTFVTSAPSSPAEFPQIHCQPVIYLSRRTSGFGSALQHVLDDIEGRVDFSGSLLTIAGIRSVTEEASGGESRGIPPASEQVLFTKETNAEQIQIAQRLGRHGSVLVQGPPGTGKTHTIANLLGHLLARGKRVLVTAHTSKALKVLREKVVPPLQTLCVSVLDNETESRKELEASVDEMVARLSAEDPDQLDRDANHAEQIRLRLLSEIAEIESQLIAARQDEYRDVVVAGVGYQPSRAARVVHEGRDACAWIPGPVSPAAAAPLGEAEVVELYASNDAITPEDETELLRWRPRHSVVPDAEVFAAATHGWARLMSADTTTGAAWWGEAYDESDDDGLSLAAARVADSVTLLSNASLWKLDAIASGLPGRPALRGVWLELAKRVVELNAEAMNATATLLDFRCRVDSELPVERQLDVVQEILAAIGPADRVGCVQLLIHRSWKAFAASSSVNGERPVRRAQFEALAKFLALEVVRRELSDRWDNQIGQRGGTKWSEFGTAPEQGAQVVCDQFGLLVEWHDRVCGPLISGLEAMGFHWSELLLREEPSPGEHPELRRIVGAIVGPLRASIDARVNYASKRRLERQFRDWHGALFSPNSELLPTTCVFKMRTAVSAKSTSDYSAAYAELVRLEALAPIFDRRVLLLKKLELAASAWSGAVQARQGAHGGSCPPGPTGPAWMWRHFSQELVRRAAVSIPALQDRLSELQDQVRRVTATLIEQRTWAHQCRRVGLSERQALQGWKDINRRIGGGYGERVPGLRLAARQALQEARGAVPIWIMPLSRVAETFDPRKTRFDVVIVDEASQCDAMGLLALYMADSAIVVGDHEQVSPLAVGEEIEQVEHLREQHLEGIPNKPLYDGKLSLYDLGRQSFGGMIRLVEHFRCMPEIISFSNELSYQREIKALRDGTGAILLPSVVAHRVEGNRSGAKTNQVEAETIVALLAAAIEQPEYTGKSVGVVSLRGDEQAFEVESVARQMVPSDVLVKRRFLCGNAAHFQGDERDVVFISLVDSPTGGPLALQTQDLFRQRFNVAASRAKDQLWVVHSLDPRVDLKPGDLRRRLIEHAEDPAALIRAQSDAEGRTESEFERRVVERLVAAGFKVRPQWTVGRYRIDMVVEGKAGRLAVECDGDRYHPIEKIPEDMARQAVLERLGWRFVRIRGSHFFRDPEDAMSLVFDALRLKGIEPEAELPIEPAPASELLDRVRRRAGELLADWKAQRED